MRPLVQVTSEWLNYPINHFEKSDEIQDFLRNQWVGLLERYLTEEHRSKNIYDINISISKLEKTTNRLEEMIEFILSMIGKPEAKKILINNEKKKEKEEFIVSEFLNSNFARYLERYLDISNLDNIFILIEKNGSLDDFLAEFPMPENEKKYLTDYKGSHDTYHSIRSAILNSEIK